MKECQAANGKTLKEVREEIQNIDYDCHLMTDLSSIPTKHWLALHLQCVA